MANSIKPHPMGSDRREQRGTAAARSRWLGTGATAASGGALMAVTAPVLLVQARTTWQAPGVRSVDEVLGAFLLTAGGVGAAWLALWATIVSLALLAAAARGSATPVERLAASRATPRLVRRALATGLGLSLLAGTAPAMASSDLEAVDLGWDAAVARAIAAPAPASDASATARSADHPQHSVPATPVRTPTAAVAAGDGVTTVATTENTGAARATGTPTAADPDLPPAPGAHVVARGDSLWAIAAAHLEPGATDGAIAAAWPRWYDANRTTVGDDPDHLTPGLVLLPPAAHPTTGG